MPEAVVVDVVVGVVVCAFAPNVNTANANANAEILIELFMIFILLNCCVFVNTAQSNGTNHLSFFIQMSGLFNRLINNKIKFS